jgi:hypothetical protein
MGDAVLVQRIRVGSAALCVATVHLGVIGLHVPMARVDTIG